MMKFIMKSLAIIGVIFLSLTACRTTEKEPAESDTNQTTVESTETTQQIPEPDYNLPEPPELPDSVDLPDQSDIPSNIELPDLDLPNLNEIPMP